MHSNIVLPKNLGNLRARMVKRFVSEFGHDNQM